MSMGRGGLFGNPKGWDVGPPMNPPSMDDIGALPNTQPTAKPGGKGIFGNLNLSSILGALGDAMAASSDMPMMYAPQMQQRRQLEQQAQLAETKRATDWEDFQRQYDYERANPKATNPHRWESNDGSLMELGPDGVPRVAYKDPSPKMNFIPDGQGGGQWVAVPSGGGMPQQQTGNPAIGSIMADPRRPGGASAPAPRPFSAAPPMKLNGGAMTSGRRTVEGNRIVGGVTNSKHLTGEAADYAGPNLNALLQEARKLPGLRRAFIHNKNHVHTEGDWNVPYFGKNGTRGR